MSSVRVVVAGMAALALVAAASPATGSDASAPAERVVTTAENPAGFEDVPPDHRFADAVAWLVAQEITTGRTPTSFDPSGEVTRGQMAAFLWRYQSSVPPQTIARFVDVPADAWNADAVSYLSEAGITQGVTADRYGGSEPVTRGQMATFLWRLSGQPPTDAPLGFSDVAPGSTHAVAIGWLAQSGVTTGVTADRYDPTGTVTRGQMAAFLWRLAGEPDLQTAGLNRIATEVEIADPDLVVAQSFDEQTGDAVYQHDGEPPDVGQLVYIPPSAPFPYGTWGEVTDVSTDGTVELTRTPLDTIWPQLDLHAQLVPVETFETASVSVGGGGFSCGANAAQVELATRFSMDPDGGVGDLRLRSIAQNIGEDELFVRAEVNTTLDVTVTGTGLPDTISCTADIPDMVGLKMVVPAPLPIIWVELNPTVSATFEATREGAGSTFVWDRTFGLDMDLELTGEGPSGDVTPYVSETSQTTAEDGSWAFTSSLEVGPEVVVLAGGVVGVGVSAAVGINNHASTECDPNLLEHGWRWVDFTASGSVFGRAQLWTKHLSATWEPLQRTFGPYRPISIGGSDAVGPHCMPDPGLPEDDRPPPEPSTVDLSSGLPFGDWETHRVLVERQGFVPSILVLTEGARNSSGRPSHRGAHLFAWDGTSYQRRSSESFDCWFISELSTDDGGITYLGCTGGATAHYLHAIHPSIDELRVFPSADSGWLFTGVLERIPRPERADDLVLGGYEYADFPAGGRTGRIYTHTLRWNESSWEVVRCTNADGSTRVISPSIDARDAAALRVCS